MLDRFYTYLKQPLFFFLFLSLFSLSLSSFSQNVLASDILTPPANGVRCRAEVVGKDTFPLVVLDAVDVTTTYIFRTVKQREQWTRIKFNVKKVYPYAIIAAAKLKEYDKALAKIHDEDLKKAFIKACEKDLRGEFEDQLKALTVSQGKILMKLIDRETERTTYDIVKQLRGSFQAAMWQAVARIFGHNMKVEYDAQTEDVLIERAVKLVESGQF